MKNAFKLSVEVKRSYYGSENKENPLNHVCIIAQPGKNKGPLTWPIYIFRIPISSSLKWASQFLPQRSFMKLKEEATHNILNTVCVYLVISNLIFFPYPLCHIFQTERKASSQNLYFNRYSQTSTSKMSKYTKCKSFSFPQKNIKIELATSLQEIILELNCPGQIAHTA